MEPRSQTVNLVQEVRAVVYGDEEKASKEGVIMGPVQEVPNIVGSGVYGEEDKSPKEHVISDPIQEVPDIVRAVVYGEEDKAPKERVKVVKMEQVNDFPDRRTNISNASLTSVQYCLFMMIVEIEEE